MNLLFPDSESYKLLSDCIRSAAETVSILHKINQKRKRMSDINTPVTEFKWTEDKIREFAEYYRKTQGDVSPELWGKDLLEAFKSQHSSSGKDWEIQCLVVDTRNYWLQKSGLYNNGLFAEEHKFEEIMKWRDFKHIHSVKRLSDEEVFTIGDVVVKYGTIESFRIQSDKWMLARCNDGKEPLNQVFIEDCKKVSIPSPKPVLFTTDDGVELFDRALKVWAIDRQTFNRVIGNGDSIGAWINGWFTTSEIPNPKDEDDQKIRQIIKEKYAIFSTEEAANEYVLMNKPCLSINDIRKCAGHEGIKTPPPAARYLVPLDELKELAQSKITP